MASTATPCKATRKDGQSCQSWALRGSDYCFMHDPDRKADRKAARIKGGKARHGRTLATADAGPVHIENVGDVVGLVARAINDVLALENSIQRARAIGYLASVICKAFELAELEERVTALEAALKTDKR